MSKVKDRMLNILDSLPEDYFDNMTNTEKIWMLVKEYIERYGEDETTIIPGTNKHFNLETLKEIFEGKEIKWEEIREDGICKKYFN